MFGVKVHVGTGVNRGTAHTVTVTDTNNAEACRLPKLLCDTDKALFGDTSATSARYKRGECACGPRWRERWDS